VHTEGMEMRFGDSTHRLRLASCCCLWTQCLACRAYTLYTQVSWASEIVTYTK